MNRVRWTLPTVALLWLAAAGTTLLPLPFVGTPIGLGVAVLSWVAISTAVIILGVVSKLRWLTLTTTAITLVLAAALLNWSSVAPGTYFATRSALFERAVVTFEPDGNYYGSELPVLLRGLSANGRVRRDESGLFFPQWLGIPDDAGGYFYSPGTSPEGAEMFGSVCLEATDLGHGWWTCGM